MSALAAERARDDDDDDAAAADDDDDDDAPVLQFPVPVSSVRDFGFIFELSVSSSSSKFQFSV